MEENIPSIFLMMPLPLVYNRDPKESDWHRPHLRKNQKPEKYMIEVGSMWVNEYNATCWVAVMPTMDPETKERGMIWKKIQ